MMRKDFRTHNNKDGSMARIMDGFYVQRKETIFLIVALILLNNYMKEFISSNYKIHYHLFVHIGFSVSLLNVCRVRNDILSLILHIILYFFMIILPRHL